MLLAQAADKTPIQRADFGGTAVGTRDAVEHVAGLVAGLDRHDLTAIEKRTAGGLRIGDAHAFVQYQVPAGRQVIDGDGQ